jgi:accessory gene regulator B
MKMIEKAALVMATGLKKRIPEHPASIAVLQFALAIALNTISIIGLTLVISLITGNTQEVLIALISFAILRQVSGGKHLDSGVFCVLVTTTFITVISYLHINHMLILMLNVASLVMILIFAPSNIDNQSRIPRQYYPHLKVISSLLVIISFLISNSTLTLSFFIQSLTLIRSRGGEIDESV